MPYWPDYKKCKTCSAAAGEPCIMLTGKDIGKVARKPHPGREKK